MVLNDMWEMVTVNFSLYYPLQEGEVIRIYGDTLSLGNWGCKIDGYDDKQGELSAKLLKESEKEVEWLTGELVRPWCFSTQFNLVKMSQRLKYKYSIHNEKQNRTIWEREPTREICV